MGNSRIQCQDCLRHSMSERPTKNTPRLVSHIKCFCEECVDFWREIKKNGRRTYQCLECGTIMPTSKTGAIDWVHEKTCSALHDPCDCGIRNKRPGHNWCYSCRSKVYSYLAKEYHKDEGKVVHRKLSNERYKRSHDSASPGQEIAIRAWEDG